MKLYSVKDFRNKSGVKDLETNKLIVPCEFEEIIINDGSIRLKLNGKWAIIPLNELYKLVYKLRINSNCLDV
jgi:hypothetical protein